MALEAAVFPQELFIKEWYAMVGGAWGHDYGNGSMAVEENEKGVVLQCGGGGCRETGSWELSCSSMAHNFDEWDVNDSSPEDCTKGGPRVPEHELEATAVVAASGRRKRRRTKTCKNKEEVENQRMTHIAVERNRRKQMNEYLAVLRSLMPASYVQRGDQASIIGGAINFVKELEQLLQSLEAEKQTNRGPGMATTVTAAGGYSTSTPFTNFFTFPQYSMSSSSSNAAASSTVGVNEAVAENHSAIADIEVTMVESHANLKVLSPRRPRQLLKMVVGLHSLQLTVLHLNVTTVDQMILYSFSVKVEEGCQLNSADEIATAVYRMLGKIQEECGGFN